MPVERKNKLGGLDLQKKTGVKTGCAAMRQCDIAA
jgi:hypothetical protein